MFQGGMFQKSKKYWEYEVADMKKRIIFRSINGFFLGIAYGYLITLVISLFHGDGHYYPCIPQLVVTMGSEINAVLLQTLLCGIIGAGFSAASFIWLIDKWGLAKQTGIYFLAVSLIMMPSAYIACWMEHSIKGVLSYFGIFALLFAFFWGIQYMIFRHNVRKLNASLQKMQQEAKE